MAKGFSGLLSVVSKRTARSIRNGSSRIRSRGSPTGRITPVSRSLRPSKGSRISPVSASAAMALMVKSLRARSSSRLSPNRTSGWRLPLRVQIGPVRRDLDRVARRRWPPIVPNRSPTVHRCSARGPRRRLISPDARRVAPRPDVVRVPPSPRASLSRTYPPTRYSSCPASRNASPRRERGSGTSSLFVSAITTTRF